MMRRLWRWLGILLLRATRVTGEERVAVELLNGIFNGKPETTINPTTTLPAQISGSGRRVEIRIQLKSITSL